MREILLIALCYTILLERIKNDLVNMLEQIVKERASCLLQPMLREYAELAGDGAFPG